MFLLQNGPFSHVVQNALYQVSLTLFEGNKFPELSFQRFASFLCFFNTDTSQGRGENSNVNGKSDHGRLYSITVVVSNIPKCCVCFHLYLIEQNGCTKQIQLTNNKQKF